jgi:hypothetical protein
MATKISAFEPVPDMPGLFTATKNNLRCTAIVLRSGQICLFSPVSGLSDAARASLSDIGDVSFLLAPNGFHNGGLVEYAAAYPDATLVATPEIHERLHGRTELDFEGLEALKKDLPDGMRLVNPDGLKNGETWLITQNDSICLWHVVDAFGAAKKNSEAKVCDHIRPNKVFPSFGMRDRDVYLASLGGLLASDPPDVLLPCHGAMVLAGDIPQQMGEIYPELTKSQDL